MNCERAHSTAKDGSARRVVVPLEISGSASSTVVSPMAKELQQLTFARPDTITVVEGFQREVKSSGADVAISVSTAGSRPRLELLPEQLGIPTDRLTINNVTQQTESLGCLLTGGIVVAALGIPTLYLSTASAAWTGIFAGSGFVAVLGLFLYLRRPQFTASLNVRCDDAEQVSQLIQRVEKLPRVDLGGTHWRYEVDPEAKGTWNEQCIARARERAQRIAQALGVRIVGVHSYQERFQLPANTVETQPDPPAQAAPMRRRGLGDGSSLNSMEHRIPMESAERAGAEIVVEFRVEPLPTTEP